MSEITVRDSDLLHRQTKTLNENISKTKMFNTAQFLICGALVKDMLANPVIKGKEKEYFDNSTEMAYSTAMHAKNCHEIYGDVVTIGSGLENIGPAKLIKMIPICKGKPKEEIASHLHKILPLRGNDIQEHYLELKGGNVDPHECKNWKEIKILVCEECEKPQKEERKNRKKTYSLRVGHSMATKD